MRCFFVFVAFSQVLAHFFSSLCTIAFLRSLLLVAAACSSLTFSVRFGFPPSPYINIIYRVFTLILFHVLSLFLFFVSVSSSIALDG